MSDDVRGAGAASSSRPTARSSLDEAALDRVCEAFADVIDAKSPFTARHSRGVAAYAALIGADAGLRRDDLRECTAPGLLHDIGKLGVPNTILDKPGKLTDEEFATMRLHPRLHARRSCAASPRSRRSPRSRPRTTSGSTAAATTAACPAGDLPVSARVLAVADVFEALTADRPYRTPMAPDDALAIARKDPGHLDQECVEALAAGLQQAAERLAA